MTMKLGKSQRDRDSRRVASVAVFRDGKILFGRRRDNSRWSLPGGHLEPTEAPGRGARRELLEETGLEPRRDVLELLGDEEVLGRDLRVWAYRCTASGEPDAGHDPDEEFEAFQWFGPDDLPEARAHHVPPRHNVVLKLLGWVPEELSKANRYWKGRDGLRIPHHTSPDRAGWDEGYRDGVARVFTAGDPRRLQRVRFPVSASQGYNLPVNQDRLRLYSRMLSGGDVLPPVVVERQGSGYNLLDGNHRQAAALKAGLTHLDALEVLDRAPEKHPSEYEDDDGWTEAKYRRGGEKEFENWVPPHAGLKKADEEPEDVEALDRDRFKKLGGRTKSYVALRAYKSSPHHPLALFLKYAVHRAENEDFYRSATPEAIKAHEQGWLAHHQDGGAAEKNGHVTMGDLHQTLEKNQDFISHLKAGQANLHDMIRTETPHRLKMINGKEHVALSRGYKTEVPGVDHDLASYADNPGTTKQFGEHVQHWYVPLKNVWHSYDAGDIDSTSEEYGNEDEFLVSNHSRLPAPESDVKPLVPRAVHAPVLDKQTQQNWRLESGHPDIKGGDITKFLGNSFTAQTHKAAIRHPAATAEHIQMALKDGNPSVRAAAVEHPNATAEHAAWALDDRHDMVRTAAIMHPGLTGAQLAHHGLGDENRLVRVLALRHPNVTPEHLTAAMGSEEWQMRAAAVSHPNATPEHLNQALDSGEEILATKALRHPKATPELIQKGLTHSNPAFRAAAVAHHSVTPEQLTTAMTDGWEGVRKAALTHKNTKPEHIVAGLGDRDPAVKKLAQGLAAPAKPVAPGPIASFRQTVAAKLGWTPKPEGLQKGLGGLMAAGALALSSGGAQGPKSVPQPHQMAQEAGFQTWSPEGLHQGLIPTAHLESSFGLNLNHAPNSKGEYHTAHGALGLKPSTAHEEYLKSKVLTSRYPGLEDPADFMKQFKSDHRFYNLVGSSHWARLLGRHGSPEKAAYAWRYGSTAAAGAPEAKIQSDLYVQKYKHLATMTGITPVAKSEDWKQGLKPLDSGHFLHYQEKPHRNEWTVTAYDHKGLPVGEAQFAAHLREPGAGEDESHLVQDGLKGWSVDVHPEHRRQGLATAMYRHAEERSGMKVHPGSFQTAEGKKLLASFSKSEDLEKMAIRDIKPGSQLPAEGGLVRHDYSHLIASPVLKQKYSLYAQHAPGYGLMQVRLVDRKSGERLGRIDGSLTHEGIDPGVVELHQDLRGKGLGRTMYEALFSHGYHHLGARKVTGDVHSSMAHRVHEGLTEKHRLPGYDPDKVGRATGANDNAYGPYEYALKAESDTFCPLLHVENPVERRLALKSKLIEPHHLRQALADEDPTVRESVCSHPGLTPELISEILSGDDDHLKEEVLRRPDLRDSELETAARDPRLLSLVAQHPGLSPGLRQRLGLELQKNIGFLLYPGFGVGQLPTGTMTVPRKDYSRYKRIASQGKKKRAPGYEEGVTLYNRWRESGKTLKPQDRHLSTLARPPRKEDVGFHETTRHRIFGDLSPNRLKALKQVVSQRPTVMDIGAQKTLHAVEGHESQHGVFARLKQNLGAQDGRKVVSATFKGLAPEQQTLIDRLYLPWKHNYRTEEEHDDEKLTYLHNYLQDPQHREQVHKYLKDHKLIAGTPDEHQQLFGSAHRAWKDMRRIAGALTPRDVGLERHPGLRSEADALKSMSDQLKRSEGHLGAEHLEDHLGFNPEAERLMSAAQFLGHPVDPEVLRGRLVDTDGDLLEAICQAAGIRTPEGRKELLAVVEVQELQKSEVQAPKSIQPGLMQSRETAQEVQKAFDAHRVEPIKLGGKHSSGTMLMRDSDGHLMLLKPGSGKQSPAAGAAEEPASQSRREAVFSLVARSWGITAVPEVQLVILDGREVAAIQMLPLGWQGLHRTKDVDPNLPRRALEPLLKKGTLHRWAVLDFVLGNSDRHGANIMVGPASDGNPIGLIDHGSSFAGPGFNPGGDPNTFTPYYLRVWYQGRYSSSSPEEKIKGLPMLDSLADDRLRSWVLALSPEDLGKQLVAGGINPAASVHRLEALQRFVSGAPRASGAINSFWVG